MDRYLIVIERTDTGFSAYAPDLSGCIATGRTSEETEQTMREAIKLHIQGLYEDGEPIPEPRTYSYTVALDEVTNGTT